LENLKKWDTEDKERIEKRREELAAKQQRVVEQEIRCVAEWREGKEKKLERARRAKDVMEENTDAFRKGK
jgi:pantothenate kinase-related protein Tda10